MGTILIHWAGSQPQNPENLLSNEGFGLYLDQGDFSLLFFVIQPGVL